MIFASTAKPAALILAFAKDTDLFITKISGDVEPPEVFSTTLSAASSGCSAVSILAYLDQSDSNNRGYLLASLTFDTGTEIRLFQIKGSEGIDFEWKIEAAISASAFTSFDAANVYAIDKSANNLVFIKHTASYDVLNDLQIY